MNVPSGKVWQPTGDAATASRRRDTRTRVQVIGVVLAGGLGTRMGAPKAATDLAGRPLVGYPLAALAVVCERVVVVAKASSDVGTLDVERWDEPDEPRHPIAGITYALERAGEPILVCGADMPFVEAEVVQALAAELHPDVPAAVAESEGRLEPLLGAYAPSALTQLRAAPAGEPLRRSVERLHPAQVHVAREVVFNVNTPDDLEEAARRLRSG